MWIAFFTLQTTFGSIAPGRLSLLGSASSGTKYLFSSLRLRRPHDFTKFRLYVGLLVNPTIYRKPSKEGQEADDDDGDDDGDGSPSINAEDSSGNVPTPKDGARPGYSVELDDYEHGGEDTYQALKSDMEEQREEKLIVFLTDPEKSIAIFLSSYMREQGLVWFVSQLP